MLTILLALAMIPLMASTAYADDKTEFYTISTDTEIWIEKYMGTSENVVIPATLDGKPVTKIYENAFQGNTTVKSVVIESPEIVLKEEVFSGCTSLESVEFTGSDANISLQGKSIFLGTTNLKQITFPENAARIYFGTNLMHNCQAPLTITIQDGTKEIIISAAAFSPYYEYTDDEDTNTNNLVAFRLPAKVDSITISDFAFEGSHLKSIALPEGTVSIGEDAFYKSSDLTTITLPTTLTTIGNSAFEDCDSLSEFSVPDTVTTLGSRAFRECDNLTNVVIGSGITAIKSSTFYECKNLKSVTLPETITSIGSSAFAYCENLESIDLPEKLTSISSSAFSECRSLKNISFPSGLESLGSAFEGCTSLTSVYIPASVTSISSGIFNNCSGLTSITVDPDNANYDSRENCNAIINSSTNTLLASCKNTVIPDSVEAIGAYSFTNCPYEKLVLPTGVKSIGSTAFAESLFTEATLPKGITSIKDWTFAGCRNLATIEIPKTVTSIQEYAFYDCSNLKTIRFGGSEEEWKSIKVGSENDPLSKAEVIYNCDNDSSGESGGNEGGIQPRIEDPIEVSPTLTLSAYYYTYNGKVQKPKAIVKVNGQPLDKQYYTVEYDKGCKGVGEYYVGVLLKGKYSGNAENAFQIRPKRAAISKITVGKKQMTVKMKTKVSATGGTKYKVSYRVKGTKKWKTVTTAKQSVTIKKLKKGKKYEVKVIAYKGSITSKYWSIFKTSKKIK